MTGKMFRWFYEVYPGSGRPSRFIVVREDDNEKLSNIDLEAVYGGCRFAESESELEARLWDELTEVNPANGLTVWKK